MLSLSAVSTLQNDSLRVWEFLNGCFPHMLLYRKALLSCIIKAPACTQSLFSASEIPNVKENGCASLVVFSTLSHLSVAATLIKCFYRWFTFLECSWRHSLIIYSCLFQNGCGSPLQKKGGSNKSEWLLRHFWGLFVLIPSLNSRTVQMTDDLCTAQSVLDMTTLGFVVRLLFRVLEPWRRHTEQVHLIGPGLHSSAQNDSDGNHF